jgi:hypothetical protein
VIVSLSLFPAIDGEWLRQREIARARVRTPAKWADGRFPRRANFSMEEATRLIGRQIARGPRAFRRAPWAARAVLVLSAPGSSRPA